MNVEVRNVVSIDLGELLQNEKSDYYHRTITIQTSEGEIEIKLYSNNQPAIRVTV
jgi:hypothetical protein